jgi:hypothetical protein
MREAARGGDLHRRPRPHGRSLARVAMWAAFVWVRKLRLATQVPESIAA